MARRVRVRGSRRQVWNGSRQKTVSGCDKSTFKLNKSGKVVSKKANKSAAKNFKNSALSKWIAATQS